MDKHFTRTSYIDRSKIKKKNKKRLFDLLVKIIVPHDAARIHDVGVLLQKI